MFPEEVRLRRCRTFVALEATFRDEDARGSLPRCPLDLFFFKDVSDWFLRSGGSSKWTMDELCLTWPVPRRGDVCSTVTVVSLAGVKRPSLFIFLLKEGLRAVR